MIWDAARVRADGWQARHPAISVPIAVIKKFVEDDVTTPPHQITVTFRSQRTQDRERPTEPAAPQPQEPA